MSPEALSPASGEESQLTASGAPLKDAQPKSTGDAVLSPSSTPLAPNLTSAAPKDEESRSPIRSEALTMARKTFKAIEIASGFIPVAGTYVAAAAKVGLAFVETIQAGSSSISHAACQSNRPSLDHGQERRTGQRSRSADCQIVRSSWERDRPTE